MEKRSRRSLDMGDRVRGFNAAHPSPDPAWVGLAEQLDAECTRAAELAELQATRDAESRASTALGGLLRRRLSTGLVRVVVRAGQAAARIDPALERRFQPVPAGLASREFIAAVRAVVTSAREHADALGPHGATPELVDRAAALLAQYVAATRDAERAVLSRVQVVAELREVTGLVTGLVGRLDAFNKDRFAEDPELLAAWASARNVVGPFRSGNGAGNGAVSPEASPPSGTGGDVQSAA